MHTLVAKLLVVMVVLFGALYAYQANKDNQEQKQRLEAEVSALKEQVTEKEKQITDKQQETFLLAKEQLQHVERQRKAVEEQMLEAKKQSEMMEQQIDSISTVVKSLEETQQIEKRMMAEQGIRQKQVLEASYLASGLSTASGLKVYIAEYYMSHGRFPISNKQLNISSPRKYANDQIKSITVSTGGRITIVYTEKTGVNNGAVTLNPRLKNGQIEWQCQSRDYQSIHHYMPQCKYTGV